MTSTWLWHILTFSSFEKYFQLVVLWIQGSDRIGECCVLKAINTEYDEYQWLLWVVNLIHLRCMGINTWQLLDTFHFDFLPVLMFEIISPNRIQWLKQALLTTDQIPLVTEYDRAATTQFPRKVNSFIEGIDLLSLVSAGIRVQVDPSEVWHDSKLEVIAAIDVKMVLVNDWLVIAPTLDVLPFRLDLVS